MSTSLHSIDIIFLGLTIHYVYLLTISHLYNDLGEWLTLTEAYKLSFIDVQLEETV